MQLRFGRIGVAGVGLIGGSISFRLLRDGLADEARGLDVDASALDFARSHGIISHISSSESDFMRDLEVLIIATPIRQMEELSLKLIPHAGGDLKAVIDVGSTKAFVGKRLSEIWGEIYVGLHPMAGKELGGPQNASPDLFEGACCVIVPQSSTSEEALSIAFELAKAIGASPIRMGPEEHDAIVACTSHLPMFLAMALSATAGAEKRRLPLLPKLVAGGFRDTTRVASGSPWLVSDIWATNASAILPLLDGVIQWLCKIKTSSPEEIEALARDAKAAREEILREAPSRWTA